MMDIYGAPNSRSTRVLWCAEELGLEYNFKKVDFSAGENKSDAYLAINPAGKTPAIVDGDFVLSESAAILEFLAQEHGKGQIKPNDQSDNREKALCTKWCSFALCELEQPLWTMAKHSFIYPEDMRQDGILPVCQSEFQNAIFVLSQELGDKEYILGDTFSVADILISHTLAWALSFQQDISHTNLMDYVQRCTARPALKRAQQKES
jgi:glutathione S-transferase